MGVDVDIQYLLWLQGLREAAPAWVESLFLLISTIAVSKALVLVTCVMYWLFDKRTGVTVVLGFVLGSLSNQFIKNTVCCYRPWVRSPAVHPSAAALPEATGYSFPSGHTQGAVNYIGAPGWFYRKRARWACVLCWAFAILVAFSRNFLGVHTPQDVIVAFVEGVAFIALSTMLVQWFELHREYDTTALVVALVITAAFLAYVAFKPYPMDYDSTGTLIVDPIEMQVDCFKSAGAVLGFAVGWFLERRYLNFEANLSLKDPKAIAVRMVVGLAVVLIFYLVPGVLPRLGADERIYQFFKYVCLLFAATYVAPVAFCAVERWLAARSNK